MASYKVFLCCSLLIIIFAVVTTQRELELLKRISKAYQLPTKEIDPSDEFAHLFSLPQNAIYFLNNGSTIAQIRRREKSYYIKIV